MAMAAAAAAAAGAAMQRAIESANAAWQPYAQARGWTFRPGRVGWGHVQWPHMDGVVDGTPVALELLAGTGAYRAAAMAVPAVPLPGHLEIAPQGWGSQLAGLFGAQDLTVGHEPFDRAYVVTSTSPDLAAALLSRSVCGEALALDVHRLAYDDGSQHGHTPLVIIERTAATSSSEVLDRLLRLLATLARIRPSEVPYR